MPLSFSAGVRDSLSNLAASLGVGKDKAAYDAFGLRTLERAQIESMYRGDWLARKVVDIVPYDSIRAWRAWSGHRAEVDRMEAAERRLGLRKILQRAMVLGRLYGGGAILIGTGETDPAALARPLDERLPRGGLVFLHVVSRWQLGVAALDNDPLSPWVGEPALYELSAPDRPALALHPSRVVRFLGHPLPDPTLAPTFWSDSVLPVLYDAIHAVALTTTGATSLMHEAKVDIVTVPNLSEHLSSVETTQQLSARFAYAAAMKSINNLLLLGDGETWSRQSVDFGGLPEMVRTFLQVAAGAADIPVTHLLGQSPAGLSATGDSDTRNYYDMIAARQELDLRPQLERLDRLIARSEGLDPGALTFAFRPLWQLDAPSQAALALSKAQATQIYAGLKLWPDAVTARLVEAQLVADGTYPNAAAVFGEGEAAEVTDRRAAPDVSPADLSAFLSQKAREQNREPNGRFAEGAGGGSPAPLILAEETREQEEEKEIHATGGPPPAVESLAVPPLSPTPRFIAPGLPTSRGAGSLPLVPLKPLLPGAAPAKPIPGPAASPPTIARPPVGIGAGGTGASGKIPSAGVPAEAENPSAAPEAPEISATAPKPDTSSPQSVSGPGAARPNASMPETGTGVPTNSPHTAGIKGSSSAGEGASNPAGTTANPNASATPAEALFGQVRNIGSMKSPAEIAAHPFMRGMQAALEGNWDEVDACKEQLPPEIAKWFIPGFIGPGPKATEPMPLPYGQKVTDTMRAWVPDDGSPNRCHICGVTTSTPEGGALSLDHQPPQSSNMLRWSYMLYRHCKLHQSMQGGVAALFSRYLRLEGIKP